jgi:hypothetical protein
MDIKELEALARAATPGEWEALSDWTLWAQHALVCDTDDAAHIVAAGHDAAYIAAANPQTVLKLCEIIREQQELIEGAYEEGWYDSRNTTSVCGHIPDWEVSKTRAALREQEPAIPETLTPKGETVPQTVENLQAIMASDAAEMLRMKEEISKLTQKLNQARQKRRAIPEGFVLVPEEITESMLAELRCKDGLIDMTLKARYKAMLAAQQETAHD